MAQLFEIQPEENPIEWTHFNCWFEEDEKRTKKELFSRAFQIIDTWAVNLSITLTAPNFKCVDLYDGFDLVIMQILEYGYDVYKGSDFIEIYAKDNVCI
jgi:hypothetical protein